MADKVSDDIIELFGDKQARDYQIQSRNQVIEILKMNPIARIILKQPTGCHAKGSKIMMADGSIKLVEDIVVGDELMGDDSTPRVVLNLVRGRQEMCLVKPTRGRSFVVNRDHIMPFVRYQQLKNSTQPSHQAAVVEMKLGEYQAMSKWGKHIHGIQRASHIELPEVELPLHPYLMGVLLGDGNLTSRSNVISTCEPEIINWVVNYGNESGLFYAHSNCVDIDSNLHELDLNSPIGEHHNPLTRITSELDIRVKSTEKTIPELFLRSSLDQRMQLLAGLLDTDSHYRVDARTFEYVTTSVDMVYQVEWLVKSVGMHGVVSGPYESKINGVRHSDHYRIQINGDLSKIPTKVARRQGEDRRQKKSILRSSITVTDLPEDDFYGFQVSGNHLYLDDQFFIHHNCGKTLTSGLILLDPGMRKVVVRDGTNRPMRVLFTSHMHRLLVQAERAFAVEENIRVITDANITTSSSVTDNYVKCNAEILYCTNNANFDPRFKPDLIFIDEGHHEGCATVQLKIHAMYGDLPQILLTATDNRLDRIQLKADAIVEPLTRAEAVERGFIMNSGLNTFIDTSGRNKAGLVAKIITDFHTQMENTLVFLRTKKEVQALMDHVDSLDLSYAALLDQSPEEVDDILNDYAKGDYQFVINCQRLGEGIDVSGASDIIIGRTLTSYTALNQYIGRTVRLGSDSRVWQIVDPLSGTNLDATIVLGEPLYHNLYSHERGSWVKREMLID